MKHLWSQHTVKLHESLYLKDPESSEIGREILRVSVEMIAESGLEAFTFRKLAQALSSTESTVYRYFHNKQQLMMYLASWYWSVLEWQLAFATANVEDPCRQMEKALEVLSVPMENLSETPHIDEALLHRIVASESFKAFVLKSLDKKERAGYFQSYHNLVDRLAGIIDTQKKKHTHPKALACTLVETAHYQVFLQSHLPELTDIGKAPRNLYQLLYHLVF
jgi:AcrR family transcriptional regulator